MGKCVDCRFYDGKRCSVDGFLHSPTFMCGRFSNNIKSQNRRCSDCRFYDGKRCSTDGSLHSPTFVCGRFSPYR